MSDIKTLPDGAGMWYSDDGQKAFFISHAGGRWWGCCDGASPSSSYGSVENLVHACSVQPARWALAIKPPFPALPPRTLMVYAKTPRRAADWWMIRAGKHAVTYYENPKCGAYTARASALEVVPHPDNDPEAVRLIEGLSRTF